MSSLLVEKDIVSVMRNNKYQVAVIGCGWIGEVHVQGFIADGRNVEVSYFDMQPEKALRCKEKYAGGKVYETLEDVLADEKIDAVDICVSHDQHVVTLKQALAANKHIMVEKPLARNVDECIEILDLAEGFKKHFLVAECWRFCPTLRTMKEIIVSGKIGRPFMINGRTYSFFVPPGWRRSLAVCGGGALLDRGIHFASVLAWLGGKIESVFARTSNTVISEMEGEDTALVSFRYESGAHGNLLVSWGSFAAPAGVSFEAFGDKGCVYEIEGEGLFYSGEPGKIQKTAPPKLSDQEMIYRTVSHFIDCLTGKDKPYFTPILAARDVAFVEASYKSARENISVNLRI